MLGAQDHHQEPGDEHVDDDDQDHGADNRLGRRAAHALSPTFGGQSVIAAHGGDDEAEHKRFGQSHEDVGKDKRLPGIAPVFVRIEAEQHGGYEAASQKSHKVAKDGQEKHHDDGRDYAWGDKFLGGIGAQGSHGVDLLGHDHGTEFAGHSGGIAPGDNQSGQHRAQCADNSNGNQLTDNRSSAEATQAGCAIQRQGGSGKEDRSQDNGERSESDQVGLLDDVSDIDRTSEQVGDRLHRQQEVFLNGGDFSLCKFGG